MLSVYISFVLQQATPNDDQVNMVNILNDISNKVRNVSDSVTNSSEEVVVVFQTTSLVLFTVSLCLVVIASAQALYLKQWLSSHTGKWQTLHDPEEEARKREVYAQGLKRWAVPTSFEFLPLLMQFAVFCFSLGMLFAMFTSNLYAWGTSGIAAFAGILLWRHGYHMIFMDPYTPFAFSLSQFLNLARTFTEKSRRSMHENAFNPEIAHVCILNRLFTHTSMTPNNLSIFIQLFSIPVQYPRLRVKSLAPWSLLSPLLPSMLMEIYPHSTFDLLPTLRLCLLVFDRGQSNQLLVNKEAMRAYSTIKTSDPLQNLYLHLLLSQLRATAGDADHWQEVCRILKCLEYSEEHTSELVWLVDSIQLYTLWIKVDFIVEFLRGVVVYLAKCPSDEQNADTLRTATIMAAEWLVSRQSSDNGNLPLRYILSSQNVHFGEENRKASQDVYSDKKNGGAFVLVENQTLSLDDRRQLSIYLYQDSHKTDPSSDSVMRTLLIPIMAIEGLAVEKNRENHQTGDLQSSLEVLWDLWEGGFNQSDLLRFVMTLVVPPSSPVGYAQTSLVIPLLEEYLRQINESSALITEQAFRFIDAALEHSLTTGATRDELEQQLQDVQSTNPWLALHIDNILQRSSTPSSADLEGVTTLDARVKAIVARKRLNLYLTSKVQPEPDILTLLIQSDDHVISLEAFGQGVSLLESPPTDEVGGRDPRSPRPFAFALLDQEKRSHLISRLFDPHQSTTMLQSVWIMLTEDLYPRWKLLPTDWRRDIATAIVEATEWMVKGQQILAEAIKKRRRIQASAKVKQLIGATALALVNRSDTAPHRKREVLLETRVEERLEACAQVYLPLFATAVEQLGESAKSRTQHIVASLMDIPDALCNEDAIRRIQHVLGI